MSPRLAFYGDDFTGSSDAMGVLADAGMRTMLFLRPPTPERLRGWPGLEAVGVAGTSRTMSPEEMDRTLPDVFGRLGALGAPLVHYKVCSTFDSGPDVGSIGRVLEIGQDLFRTRPVPVLAGAPALGRFCVFGNLFARAGDGSAPYRLDRHPTMRRHPATPMEEADLRLHLARQTARRIGLFSVLDLAPDGRVEERYAHLLRSADPDGVLLDVLAPEHLPPLGRLLWRATEGGGPPTFVIGSSGVEHALTTHWRAQGSLPPPLPPPRPGPAARIAVVSGSCAPVTGGQIAWAAAHGFADVALDAAALCGGGAGGEIGAAVQEALGALSRGQSVVLHTSRGPDDPRIPATVRRLRELGHEGADVARATARTLGGALGRILREIAARGAVRRMVVVGGDTSAHVAEALGIEALEPVGPLAPGAPLCRIHAPGGRADAMEIVFKGGQMGTRDFFARAAGAPPAAAEGVECTC